MGWLIFDPIGRDRRRGKRRFWAGRFAPASQSPASSNDGGTFTIRLERPAITLQGRIDRKTTLARKLSRTRTAGCDKDDLRFQTTPHVLQSIKIDRALKGLVVLRQHHRHLLATKLVLCQNCSQDALSVIV